MSKNAVTLPSVDLESILLSIKNKDTYAAAIPMLQNTLSDLRSIERQALDAYVYLVKEQLKGELPTQSTLIQALSHIEALSFKNKQSFPDEEVLQKIEIYAERRKRLSMASLFSSIPEEILNYGITNKVIDLCNRVSSQLDVSKDYTSIAETYDQVYSQKVEMKGISFLCPALDELTGGMAPGTICTILGGSGSMKTTTTVNICYNAVKEGKNIAYLSLEETPLALFNKIMSRTSVDVGKNLPVKSIAENSLSDSDKEVLLKEVYPYFKNLPGNFYLIGEQDLGDYSLSTFESKLKEVDLKAQEDSKRKNNEDNHGIDIVVVDHIQLLKYSNTYQDELSITNQFVSFFRQQSLSFLHQKREIVVILISQANREGTSYADKHDGAFKMYHLAESNELERSSTYVISVYTNPMSQISKLLKMGAVKLRGASLPMDTINVFADGEYYQVGQTSTPEQTEYTAADLGLDDNTPINQSISDASLDSIFDGVDLL